MQEFLSDNQWVLWLALSVGLAAAELLSLDLILLMLAVGALGGAVVAAVQGPVILQVLVALAISLGMLTFVRPNVVRRLHRGPELTTGHAALVGKQAIVLETVDARTGRIKLRGQIWSARSVDESVIAPGSTVDVYEIDGATAVVYRVSEQGL
jgi:membrane protein implicated in regulation of membrane protease activity